MTYEKDFKDFGYYVKALVRYHSKGEIDDKAFIELIKKELETYEKENA